MQDNLFLNDGDDEPQSDNFADFEEDADLDEGDDLTAEIEAQEQNGECCTSCGRYFTESHGKPVVCAACYEKLPPDVQPDFTKATHATIE